MQESISHDVSRKEQNVPTSTAGPPLLIHPTPTDEVNWLTDDSIYNWIIKFKPSSGIKKISFVSSFGANFPLQGRGETLQMLLHGTKDRNGI
ncbi:unnamed protein product [Rhizophagus irregularis]|nr:unnamed protein product [Rhizophagus irregularis]